MIIPPLEFPALAKRTGLMGRLNDWAVAEACRQVSYWRDRGPDLYVSVNPASSWQ